MESFGQPLSPVVPNQGMQTHLTPKTFGWNLEENATSYTFELSTDSLFSTLIHSENTNSNVLNYSGSLSNNTYYWKLTAHFLAQTDKTSQTHKFTIFTPAGHPNLKLWIAADTGVVITGGAVSQWNDLSGNNFHLTQATAGNRPILQNNAIGNKPAVKFDGVNDFMRVDFGQTFNVPITIIAVWNRDATGQRYLLDGINTSQRTGIVSNYGGNRLALFSTSSLLYARPFETTPFIMTSIFNNNQSQILENSILRSTGNVGSTFGSGVNLGARFSNAEYLNGNVFEIIYINDLLSDNSRLQIENYLNSKHAPAVSLGYDIKTPYLLCDTAITGANKSWFTNWLWSSGDTTPTIRVNQSGKYWVRATNIFGIVSSDTIMVYYTGHQTFSDTTICLGDTLTYTYTKDLPYQINWSNGDTGKVFKTTLPGNYSMTLTDSLGCSWQTSFIVSIDSFPNFNLLPENVTLCAGNQIQANIHPNTASYLWSPGNESSSFKTVFQSDTYRLTAQNAHGCQAQDSIAVTIQGVAPNPNFQWSLACTNDSIHFINLSHPIDSIASYSWNFNNGFNSNLINPSFVFDTAGTYSANLSIDSYSGCYKDTTIQFQVYKKPHADFEHLLPCINTPTPFYNLSDLNQGYITESISWYINDNLASNEIHPELSFSDPQEFMASLVVQSTNGCSDSISKNLNTLGSYPNPENFSLVYPQNNVQTSESFIQFQWNPSENAQYYRFELSDTANFSNIIESQWLIAEDFPKTYNSNPISDNKNYFWRITAFNPCLDSTISNINTLNFFRPNHPNLKLWIAADTGVVITDGAISQWKDLSGNNFHLSQATATNRPTLQNNTIGDKPAVKFDGLNDFMRVDFGQTFNVPITIIAVWNRDATGQRYLLDGINTSQRTGIVSNYGGNRLALFSTSSLLYARPFETTPFIMTSIFNNNQSQIIENSILRSTGNVGSTFGSGVNLGARFSNAEYLNGNVFEIIYINDLLSDNSRLQIENYLNSKHAPAVSLGYDIKTPYLLCDTAITGANKSWFTNWLWSSGDTTPTIRINQSGIVWVRATNIFGIVSSDTIMVYYTGHQTFSDTTICLGDTLTYTYTKDLPYQINWSNGDTGNAFKTTLPGNYSMTLTDSLGCSWQTSFQVQLDSLPALLSLGHDRALCTGETLIPNLGSAQSQNLNYLWMDNSTAPSIIVQNPGEYSLQVSNQRGCIAYDTVQISLQGITPIPAFDALGVCLGNATLFTDASSSPDGSDIITWQWDFGDLNFANTQNPSNTYLQSGIYPVKLRVITENLCAAEMTSSVAVYSLPSAQFSPLTACAQTPLNFRDNSVSEYSINDWNWQFNNPYHPNPSSNIQNPTHTFDSAGTYSVQLIVKNIFSCSDTITKEVEIRPGAMADFYANTACEGTNTWFNSTTQTASFNPIVSYRWEYSTLFRDSLPVSSFRFDTAGVYPVKHSIKLLNGCQSEVTKNIKVAANPQALFNNPESCLNTTYSIIDQSSIPSDQIVSTRWYINNQFYAENNEINLIFPQADTYSIKQIVTSNENCSDTLTLPVTIHPIPLADFNLAYDDNTIGNRIIFTNTSQDAISYLWNFGDNSTSNAPNPSHDYPLEGSYIIQLIATNVHQCTDTTHKTITIANPSMDLHLLNVDFKQNDNYVETELNIVNLGNRNVFSIWLDSKINDKTNREEWIGVLRPGEIINYTLRSKTYLPSYQSINYACMNISSDDYPIETNHLNNKICFSKSEEFTIYELYPNPAQESITIIVNAPNDQSSELRIYHPDGRTALSPISQSLKKGINQIQIDLSPLKSGIYNLQIISEGETISRKFVVVK